MHSNSAFVSHYEIANETIISLNNPVDTKPFYDFCSYLRKQCLEDMSLLQVSDVAIALHDQLAFIDKIPLDIWAKNGHVVDLEELKLYVKVKKDAALIIRSLYSQHSEKIFYAIIVVYLLQNKNIITQDDNCLDQDFQNFDSQGDYSG